MEVKYLGTLFSDEKPVAFGSVLNGSDLHIWVSRPIFSGAGHSNKFYKYDDGKVVENSDFENFMQFVKAQRKVTKVSGELFIFKKDHELVVDLSLSGSEEEIATALAAEQVRIDASANKAKEIDAQEQKEPEPALQAQNLAPAEDSSEKAKKEGHEVSSREAHKQKSAARNAAARNAAARAMVAKGKATLVVNVFGARSSEKSEFTLEIAQALESNGNSVATLETRAEGGFDGSVESAARLHNEQMKIIAAQTGEVDIIVVGSPSVAAGAFIKEASSETAAYIEHTLRDYQMQNNFGIMFQAEGREANAVEQKISNFTKEHDIYVGKFGETSVYTAAESIAKRHETIKGEAEKLVAEGNVSRGYDKTVMNVPVVANDNIDRVAGLGELAFGGFDDKHGAYAGAVQFEDNIYLWVSDVHLEKMNIIGLDPMLTEKEKSVIHAVVSTEASLAMHENPESVLNKVEYGCAHLAARSLGEKPEVGRLAEVRFEWKPGVGDPAWEGRIRAKLVRGEEALFQPMGGNLYYREFRGGSVSGPWEKAELDDRTVLVKSQNAQAEFDKRYKIDIGVGELQGSVRIDGQTYPVDIEPGQGLAGVEIRGRISTLQCGDVELVKKRCLEIVTGADDISQARVKAMWQGLGNDYIHRSKEALEQTFYSAIGAPNGHTTIEVGSTEDILKIATSMKPEVQQEVQLCMIGEIG